ncbi:hypothetical protein QIW49_04865 [Francisellaceae bacterium CB300]
MGVIISAVIGLISGAIGSLVAPWINWGIEKKRKRYERRVELIQIWRNTVSFDTFNRSDILEHSTYGILKKLMKEDSVKVIERPPNHINVVLNSPTRDSDKDLIVREIARIEQLWKLV